MLRCPNCGSEKIGFCATRNEPPDVFERTGIETVDYMGCFDCTLIFQKIPLDPSYYKRAYRNSVRLHSVDPMPGNLVGEHNRAVSLIAYLKEHNVVPKKVLDVGCSTGLILRELKKEFGCETTGVEPGDSFRDYSNSMGTKTYENIGDVKEKFDFITTTHVLEHQTEPMLFLKQIAEKMEGLVFIEVPYLNPSLWHHIMFTAETLEDMVKRAGIEIVHRTLDNPLRILGRLYV